MKKTVSLILCAVMLLGALVLPTAAEENVYQSPSDALVAHYDFEGTDNAEKLANKAEGAVDADKLVINGSSIIDFSEDGIAHTAAGANNMYVALTDESDLAATIKTGTEMTFYVNYRVKADGATAGGFRDCFRVYNGSNYIFRWYAGNCNTANSTKPFTLKAGDYTQNNVTTMKYDTANNNLTEYVGIAISLKKVDTKWTYNVLRSDDGGKTFTSIFSVETDKALDMSVAKHLSLGNFSQNANVQLEYYFDDFRVYNKALTVDELIYDLGQAPEGAICHGVQSSFKSGDAAYDVRFVGSIDSLDYKEVGFMITADGGRTWNKKATCVYDSITGNTEAGIKEYSAAELRGEGAYLYALTIQSVPADITVTFNVTPYYIDADGETVNGTAYTIVYANGEFQSSVAN